MRKPLVAGNWKMNLNKAEAVALATALRDKAATFGSVDTVLIPPFVYLDAVNQVISGSAIGLGAQDLYFEKNGAFTGEISAAMLRDLNVDYVLIGHSERRHVLGENDALLNKKLLVAVQNNLTAILCVGEMLDERKTNKTFDVVKHQLVAGLAGAKGAVGPENLVIAYEPVWAIGTGLTASPQQAQEVHAYIREQIAGIFDKALADNIIIQYGGSVKASNAAELIGQKDIDGALVGGASLKADEFAGIIAGAAQKK
jgi:triosephosphate isomerase